MRSSSAIGATDQLKTADTALKGLQSEIVAEVVPELLLERPAEIEALAGDIAMHEKALRDRGNRSRELEAQKNVTAQLRTQLGRAAPENPARVDPALRTSIEKLSEDQATLLERERVAREHLRECDDADDRAAQALRDTAAPPDAPDTIVIWTAAATEQVPLALAASKQNGAVERAIAKLVATAGALSSPFDPRTRLPAEPPPAAVIAAYQAQVDELDAEFADQRAERNRLARRRDELQVQLAVLGAEGSREHQRADGCGER